MLKTKISSVVAELEPALKIVAIVEDFEPFRGILERMVARMGYTTQSFPTAEDFVCAVHHHQEMSERILQHWIWGCLLTDINLMEGSRRQGIFRAIDGLALVRQLRALDKFSALPTIVMSGDPSIEPDAVAAGASDFFLNLSKDLNFKLP